MRLAWLPALLLAACAAPVDPETSEPIDQRPAGELALEQPDPPCRIGEDRIEVPIGECARVDGFHWLPDRGRRSYGACGAHTSGGFCDLPLTICVARGAEVVIADECTPCTLDETGEWGVVE